MEMEVDMQMSADEIETGKGAVKKRGITGSTLKMIAIITMFIDHTGAVILERMLFKDYAVQIESGSSAMLTPDMIDMNLYMVDMILRLIGRLGFPIFCFLLIEGFVHTRNVAKYAGRMFLFALISEIPFDLGFAGQPFFMGYQNVFFTLFIGLLVIIGFRCVEKTEWNKGICAFLKLVILAGGMYAATLLKTDYKYIGVLTIAVMYLFRNKRTMAAGLGCAVLTAFSFAEITAFFTMIPIHKYNGERGWNIKWLFYIFYPAHILLLYLIAYAMGLGAVSLAALL